MSASAYSACKETEMADPRVAGVPTDLYIGGTWRESADAGRFPVADPATGEPIAQVANATVADGLAAVEAAYAAAGTWAATAPRQRGEVLRTAFTLMTQRADDLAALM